MSVMVSDIINNSTIIQRLAHAHNKENIKAPHYRPFVRGIRLTKGQ